MKFNLKDFFGYLAMVALLVLCVAAYYFRPALIQPGFPTIFIFSASAAVITMTISVFWLWKEERVAALEKIFGVFGHIPHCGYCLSLWIAAVYVGFFGINLIDISLPKLALFLISWWGLGFLNILFFAIMTTVWFKKVHLELSLRDLYERSPEHQNK